MSGFVRLQNGTVAFDANDLPATVELAKTGSLGTGDNEGMTAADFEAFDLASIMVRRRWGGKNRPRDWRAVILAYPSGAIFNGCRGSLRKLLLSQLRWDEYTSVSPALVFVPS